MADVIDQAQLESYLVRLKQMIAELEDYKAKLDAQKDAQRIAAELFRVQMLSYVEAEATPSDLLRALANESREKPEQLLLKLVKNEDQRRMSAARKSGKRRQKIA